MRAFLFPCNATGGDERCIESRQVAATSSSQHGRDQPKWKVEENKMSDQKVRDK